MFSLRVALKERFFYWATQGQQRHPNAFSKTFVISSWGGSQISRIVAVPAFVFFRLLRLRHSVEKLGLWPAYSHVTSWLMNVCCTWAQFHATDWRIWCKASLNNHDCVFWDPMQNAYRFYLFKKMFDGNLQRHAHYKKVNKVCNLHYESSF